jgi:hypothetical protein
LDEQMRIAAVLSPYAATLNETAVAAFRESPGFDVMLRRAVDGWLTVFQAAPPELRYLSKDRGGFMLAFLMMGLQGASPEISLNGLKMLCQAAGFASPGRVGAFVGYLMQRKIVTEVETAGRGAVLHLGAPFADLFRSHLRSDIMALEAMSPSVLEASALLEGDGVFEGSLWVCTLNALITRPPSAYSAILELPGQRSAGIQILWDLILSGTREHPDRLIETSVSIAAIARRFEVSRPHVTKLLDDCAATGLVEWIGPGRMAISAGFVEAAELGWSSIFLSTRVAFQAWIADKAASRAT